MVLWEASPLGDGFAWGRVAERARLPQGTAVAGGALRARGFPAELA